MAPWILSKLSFNKNHLQQLAVVGIVGSLNPILLFIALQLTQASVAPLIYAVVPSVTALYLYLAKQQQLSPEKIVGMVSGFVGVSLVVLEPILLGESQTGSLLGNSLIFLAAIAFAGYGILSKQVKAANPTELTFAFIIMTLLLSLPLAIWEVSTQGIPQVIELKHWLAAGFVGVGGTAAFYFLYQKALSLGNEVTASLFTYLQPIFTAVMAVLLLGEQISWLLVVGGLISILGARLAAK